MCMLTAVFFAWQHQGVDLHSVNGRAKPGETMIWQHRYLQQTKASDHAAFPQVMTHPDLGPVYRAILLR